MCLIGNDHGGRLVFVCLFCQQFYAVVGGQAIYLKTIFMLIDDFQGLGAYGAR